MDRFQAVERSAAARHSGRRTWDIFHVWPDRFQRDGVVFTSTVHCFLAEPVSTRARIKIWVPKIWAGEEFDMGWGSEVWNVVGDWGMCSVVSLDDVPLVFYWELTAGKGEAAAPKPLEIPGLREPEYPIPGL
jgi:hypothetical protein